MAKKKVMLFIVEGPTDETSLSTVLNRIFSSSTVKFQVVHGDILTRDFTSADKIVAAVWEQVKEFMGRYIVPRVGRPLYGYKYKNAAAFFPQIFSTICPSVRSSAGYWPLSANSPSLWQRIRR